MRLIYILTIISLTLFCSQPILAASGENGQLIKSATATAVYIVKDSNRYVFPDLKTYQSWYGNDFSAVTTVSSEELAGYKLTGNVTYKPGSLIKIQTDPKVYEVNDDQGSISVIADEPTAVSKFGSDWATLVRDVPDAFFVNYAVLATTPPGATPETPTTTPPITTPTTTPITFNQTPAEPTKESSNLIRLTNNNVADSIADIDWTGSSYGLVWVEADNLYFSYVQGSTLNVGTKIKLNGDYVKALSGQITWDDVYFGVVWKGQLDNQTNLYFSKLSTDGRIWVDQKKIATLDEDSTISITNNSDTKYAVAWDKSTAASSDVKEIFFANLDDVGEIKNSIVQVTSSDSKSSSKPIVRWNNADYGVFWLDQKDGNGEIYYSRLDTSGAKLVSDTRITNNESESYSPAITWDGTTYGLVFRDSVNGDGYYFNRVYYNGTKVMTSAIKLAGPSTNLGEGADIAYLNNFYYIASSYKTLIAKADDGAEMYLLKVTESGDIRLETRLTYDPWQSIEPQIIISGDSYGIGWTDGRATCDNCSLNEPKRNELYFTKIEENPKS